MGFFSNLVSGITGGDLVDAGVTIAGTLIGRDANEDAADTVAQGNREAALINERAAREAREAYQENAERAIVDIDAGVQSYIDLVEPQLTSNLLDSSDPGRLNPAQAETRRDLLRDATRSISAARRSSASSQDISTNTSRPRSPCG